MVVKLNPKYLEIPKEAIWYLLRFQIHCQCIRRLDAGNDELFEYWPWNKKGEEVAYKIREKERKTRDAPRSKPEKKKKVSLKKLERTQRVRGEGLERVAYDSKSVKKFGVILE